ncbi:MAG: glutamate--tRNA ligase [Phycisphaerae bacterium]|nr:glutamate--tRNA ligase [Phycisphaerae bacterium]
MIVTRFAPSPTGYLHVGGARTALFNWLYARRAGGKFILRIEDTDLKRNTPTAMQQVIDDLRWLGIDWDEGPEVGGPNGPYLQSQRRDIYDRYIRQLLDEGKAYYCFETTEELGALREEAAGGKQGFAYQRPEVFATHDEAEQARAEGRPVTVRLKVQQEEVTVVNDVVRGEVCFGPGEVGDFIILKSDGFPTYHFAVVVDDELMGVTHVIRGQEHLMNTPAHQALQKALGFRIPVYAHMSVTVSETGGKLSKRERPKALRTAIGASEEIDVQQLAAAGGIDIEMFNAFVMGKLTPDMPAIDAMAEYLGVHLPEINVVDFFRSGYLPETMVNFLALLGWNPGDDREVMTREEVVAAFDISRMAKSNSLFDRKKLLSFNTEHIRIIGHEKLSVHLRRYLEVVGSPVAAADDEMLMRLVRINEGARTLADIDAKCRFLFVANNAVGYDPKAVQKILLKADGLAVLKEVRERLAALETLTPESIETVLRSLAEEKQIGLGKVAQPLRVAICGTTVSPPIFDSVELLGLDNTLDRIDIALKRFAE